MTKHGRQYGRIFFAGLSRWASPDRYNISEHTKKINAAKTVDNSMNAYPKGNVKRLFLSLEETAMALGLSVRTMYELRYKHPLYAPDGSRTTKDNPKKDSPLWSNDLVELIAFARSITTQRTRHLTDDEALKIRKGMGNKKRNEYLAFIED